MNYDEFAFFNRQLAEMLRNGIPLEGALRQLAANMREDTLRAEVRLLETDLAKGVPLAEALPRRQLPAFYTRMVRLGAAGGDLPGMLTTLADYYERRDALWTRLKALIVYPAMVLAAALALSLFLLWLNLRLIRPAMAELLDGQAGPTAIPLTLWAPLVWLGALALLVACAVSLPAWRDWLGWRLPGFKESNLAQLASALHLLLQRGGNLSESVALMRDLEGPSPAGRELAGWHSRLASGQGRVEQFTAGARVFPPLFLWLITQSGEDLARGFQRAAEIYIQRARHQTEMLHYAALPVAVITLGLLILIQVGSGMLVITRFLNALGSIE